MYQANLPAYGHGNMGCYNNVVNGNGNINNGFSNHVALHTYSTHSVMPQYANHHYNQHPHPYNENLNFNLVVEQKDTGKKVENKHWIEDWK